MSIYHNHEYFTASLITDFRSEPAKKFKRPVQKHVESGVTNRGRSTLVYLFCDHSSVTSSSNLLRDVYILPVHYIT